MLAIALVFRCETGKSRSLQGFAGEFRAIRLEAGEARPVEGLAALLHLFGKGLRRRQRVAALGLRFG